MNEIVRRVETLLRNRRYLIIGGTAVAVVCAVAICWEMSAAWQHRHLPSQAWKSNQFNQEETFQHLACRTWKTESGERFYAIAVGYCDFEPVIPTLNYEDAWNVKDGGQLLVNGNRIEYSARKRLLALDPFGQMVELQLSDAEAEIVWAGNAAEVWYKVVVPRLYSFSGSMKGEKRDGHWISRDHEGRMAYEGDYFEGLRTGRWLYYRKDGALRAELNYSGGRRDGKWTYYSVDGQVQEVLTWRKDVPVDRPVSQAGIGHADVVFPDARSWHSGS